MDKKAGSSQKGETTYELIRARQDQGVDLLYRRYGRKLFHYALQSWKLNDDDAWEMVYQTLYKTIEKINNYTFNSEKDFSSFLFTIFCNLLRRHYRDSRSREENLSLSPFSESLFDEAKVNPALHTERRVQDSIVDRSVRDFREEDQPGNPRLAELEQSLARLDDWERVLLLLRAQNMPYNEIASYLNKPADQLKVYYHRCRKKLEDMLTGGKMKNISNNEF